MKTIQLQFDGNTGKLKIENNGFASDQCVAATATLLAGMKAEAVEGTEVKKAEFYQEPTIQVDQHINVDFA